MIFNYFSDNVNFLTKKVYISENCEPRTEALHSKNYYNSMGFGRFRRPAPELDLGTFSENAIFPIENAWFCNIASKPPGEIVAFLVGK